MKRVLFAVVGTVLGLVALLSFKTKGHPLATPPGGLPSASVSTPATTGGASSAGTATSAPPDPSRSSASTSTKKFLGSAVQTRYGIVQVALVASGAHIASVSFAQLTAFDGRSQEINSQAAPILLQETLAAQNANIDTVSGATYTSDGYEQSLQSALDQAGIR
jgi:uncharacterized protein with FMN-binding domain